MESNGKELVFCVPQTVDRISMDGQTTANNRVDDTKTPSAVSMPWVVSTVGPTETSVQPIIHKNQSGALLNLVETRHRR
jgi:hypothetical protein